MYYLKAKHHCGFFCLLHGDQNNNSICLEISSAHAYLCFTFPDSISALKMPFAGLCTSEGNLIVVIYDAQISVV